MSNNDIKFTAPGMDNETAASTIKTLEQRLVALLDLQLTLKHITQQNIWQQCYQTT